MKGVLFMYSVRMYSKADMAQGHGVLSAHDEQVAIVRNYLGSYFEVVENGRQKCDLNHFHTINPGFLFKAWAARFKKCKNIGFVHFLPETLENSISLPKPIKWLFYKYVLFFYRQMDALVTVNPYFIDVLEGYGISRDKVTYIPNVVSSERFFQMEAKDKLAARSRFGLSPDKFTVLCAGQLQKRKGVLEFIQIAKALPEMQFVWAGDFSFGRISMDYELIKKAVANPPENVHFLGLVKHEDMNALYNACDVMLLPSYEELFPMTVLEAMSCQTPVVVRNLPIYENILFDFVQYGKDNEDFMRILRKLKDDKAYFGQCSRSAACGSSTYSEKAVADAWRKYYLSVLFDKKPVPVISHK